MANQNPPVNGTDVKVNRVDELHALFLKNGGKAPPAVQNKKLVDDYTKAKKAKAAAKKAVEVAQAEESRCVEAIILANGKGRLKIGGAVCIPMTKGDTVFFRGEGSGEVKEIG